MWLTHVAIKRPVAMTMFFVAIAFLGWNAYQKLPKQLFPDVEIPIVSVTTIYPGASPDDVERLIADPIEQAVSTVNRVDEVRTTSREGLCNVVIQFEVGADEKEAAADIRDKVFGVLNQLPDDAEQPIVQKFDIAAQPTIMAAALSDRLEPRELRTLADRTIKDRVSGAAGVASVAVAGGEVREIQVRVRQDRLRAIGMSLLAFRQWLTTQSLDLPGGSLQEGEKEISVRVLGEFASPEEIRNLTIPTGNGGTVRLRDIADVSDSAAEPQTLSRINGRPSVTIVATKTSSANVIETADAIKARLNVLEQTLPGDVKFVVSSDESVFTKDALHDLVTSLFYGIVLATLVVWVFLRNFRATLAIFIAIPTSLLATFMLMRLIGYTMNFMTMLGLALVIGILVDDSIVVLENIYRHLAMGKDPTRAAIEGRMEIGLAAVAITLTDVVVFVPIALMGGIVGKFFRPFGATVAFATLFSLIVSFTLTPMMAARWMRPRDVKGHAEEGDAAEQAVRRRTPYVRALDFCISRWGRWITLASAALLLVGVTIFVGGRLGASFFSRADQGEFTVYIELPLDKNLEATDAKARQVEEILSRYEEIEAVLTETGRSAAGRGKNLAQMQVKCIERAQKFQRIVARLSGRKFVQTRDGHTLRVTGTDELCAAIQAECDRIGGAAIRVRPPQEGAAQGVNPVEIQLFGPRDAGLVEYAQRVYERIAAIPEFQGTDITYKTGRPELQAKLDRVRLAELGFSVAEVAATIRTAVEGDNTLKYRERGNEYDIRIQLAKADSASAASIPELVVGMRDGDPIRLRDIAQVTLGEGPAELTRLNRQDMITVSLDPGLMAMSEANRIALAALEEIPRPPGISYKVGGSVEMMQESFGYMVEALMISVVMVFALLCMLYESWFYPFVIMLGVPMATTGAYIGLKLAGCRLDIFAMIGMIMLMGLVTKNSILLVDYTNTLRARGYSRRDALLRAGPTRFRPIVMTTLTLVLSLSPISTGLGKGAEFRQPLGASVTGGMIFSTILTLLVIPAFYTVIDDIQERIYLPIKRFIFRIRSNNQQGGEVARSSEVTSGEAQ